MEIQENRHVKVQGAEGIVLHDDSVILGMQKPKRWYTLINNKKATIIKTLGGQVEETDENSSRRALKRELMEEMSNIEDQHIIVSEKPVLTKRILMSDLNPYEPESTLTMQADFYLVEIRAIGQALPNDLPALIKIPISELINMPFGKSISLDSLKEYLIINSENNFELPQFCALMIPEEVRNFLERIRKSIENEVTKGDDER